MKHNNHLKDLTLYVVKTQGPALFGEDWLHKIKLFPKRSHQSTQNKVEKVLDEYSEVFQDEICTLKSTKAKLTLKEGSKAKFCKVWQVPYTMKPEVEVELRCLEDRILHIVKFSDWSTPIVPVIKPNGAVLICGRSQ